MRRRRPGSTRATGRATPVPLGLDGPLLAEGSALRRRLDLRTAAEGVPHRTRTAGASAPKDAVPLGRAGDPGAYRSRINAWTKGAPA
jgi:hypothetical protein